MQTTIQSILKAFLEVMPLVFPLLFGLVLLVFLWGVVRFLWATSEKEQAEGKTFLFWGVIGLFVAASVWGLVALLQQIFGVDTSRVPSAPEIKSFQKRP